MLEINKFSTNHDIVNNIAIAYSIFGLVLVFLNLKKIHSNKYASMRWIILIAYKLKIP
jgi:hypothetical protein